MKNSKPPWWFWMLCIILLPAFLLSPVLAPFELLALLASIIREPSLAWEVMAVWFFTAIVLLAFFGYMALAGYVVNWLDKKTSRK